MQGDCQDFLGWGTDLEILQLINNEMIIYSNKLYKFNSYSIKQERNIILTHESLYNLKNKIIKRQMKYEEMLGITFSSQSNEFVIHAHTGHDFHFMSPHKKLIILIIAKTYQKILNKPIILCEVPDKSLKQYVTTKKEKRKSSTNSRLNEINIIDTQTFIIDNAPFLMNKRSNTGATGSGSKSHLLGSIPKEKRKTIISEVIFSNDKVVKSAGFDDFEIIKLLGRGISGKVLLALSIFNKKYYAIKSVDKKVYDFNKNALEKIQKISDNDFPFIINVDFCYDTANKIYFAFPYIEGEEFSYYLQVKKRLDEGTIKFYAGILALTFDFCTTLEIENKSFTPRNIIINKDGYLQLIPFHVGSIFNIKTHQQKKILNKYKNEYSAPELFLEDDSLNRKGAFWWNLGILIYEMFYGITPFYTTKDDEMGNIITNGELKFPENSGISENLKDLIKKLLNKKFEERLGYQNGISDIKSHDFFKDLNFEELKNKKLKAPYMPVINNDLLTNNNNLKEKYTYEDLKKAKVYFK